MCWEYIRNEIDKGVINIDLVDSEKFNGKVEGQVGHRFFNCLILFNSMSGCPQLIITNSVLVLARLRSSKHFDTY